MTTKNKPIFAKLPVIEQELVICRSRADLNTLQIYSSDTRVSRRIAKSFPKCIDNCTFDNKKRITGVFARIEINQFSKVVFLPQFRGAIDES